MAQACKCERECCCGERSLGREIAKDIVKDVAGRAMVAGLAAHRNRPSEALMQMAEDFDLCDVCDEVAGDIAGNILSDFL